eukprot:gnl/MRDRNA2_/MRDRNA2_99721_c0_seq1.p1 gnl/MRDRNA2_/MRDRNA2_99721_c0~~gnl/MRDRNA2_/MRDRNA2_99721_c0_seq1.p1  ORF type:complete len:134 (-),score=30.14 gnl/MRDRNA2_/MRDRNA2_99721_c0_seq1:2-403(-)
MSSSSLLILMTMLTYGGAVGVFLGRLPSDAQFAGSAAGDGPARAPGYRNAWDDCGGVGASATERMRTIAAGIKGWAKPLPFVRNAAQDCGSTDPDGLKPGPGPNALVYPGPEITKAANDGLAKAAETMDKYGK